ncbi:hypothetical protein KA977_11265 [Candidatus Dependentiae bacterium]|nr:hypothetical protein [Candidatus Dependentiae bacterium]
MNHFRIIFLNILIFIYQEFYIYADNAYNNNVVDTPIFFSKYYKTLIGSDISNDSKNEIFSTLIKQPNISDFDRLTAIVYFAETEKTSDFSLELKKFLLKIPYSTQSELKEILIYSDFLKPNFQNKFSKLSFEKIINKINEHLNVTQNDKHIKSGNININISADWFSVADRYKTETDKYDFTNKLKHSITEFTNFDKPVSYSSTGDLILTGKIEELEFAITEKDANDQPLELRLKILYNYELTNKTNNKKIIKENGIFKDFIFKTKNYSEHSGLTERDAIDELIKLVSIDINSSINKITDNTYDSLLTEKKQKQEIEKNEFPKDSKSMQNLKITGKVEIDYEHITIDGNYESAGENSKETNRFTSKQYIDFDWKNSKNIIFKGGIITKLNNYLDKRKDLEKLYAEYKKNNITLKFGNLFTEFSKNTFNNSYEGLYLDYKILDDMNIEAFAGREKAPHDNLNFTRLNAGMKTKWNYSDKNNFSVSAVFSKDDENSISFDSSNISPEKNTIFSFSGTHKTDLLVMDYEYAGSWYDDDIMDTLNKWSGSAIKFNSSLKKNNHKINAGFSRITPNYNSINSSITADRQKYNGGYETLFINGKIIFNFSTLYQYDNLDKSQTSIEYLKENLFSIGYTPFSDKKNNLFQSLKLSADYQMRDNYNKQLTNQPNDKDIKNNILKIKSESKFLNRSLSCIFLYEKEKENDYIEKNIKKTKIYEASSNYSKKILEYFLISSNIKYRVKSSDSVKDKYINGSASLKYNKRLLTSGLNYYLDIIESSIQNNDIYRQKYGINIEYSFKKESKNISIRSEIIYETNDYERTENNYNKLNLITNLIINF